MLIKMRAALLFGLLAVSPAYAGEAWTYLDRPDCVNPVIWIAEEADVIERLDFLCSIKEKVAGEDGTTYVVECSTDQPSLETMRVIVTPNDDGSAEIEWQGLDTDTYRRCLTDHVG